jgi:hypothetical protein
MNERHGNESCSLHLDEMPVQWVQPVEQTRVGILVRVIARESVAGR